MMEILTIYSSGLQGVHWCTLVYMNFFLGCTENLVKWIFFLDETCFVEFYGKKIIIKYNNRF